MFADPPASGLIYRNFPMLKPQSLLARMDSGVSFVSRVCAMISGCCLVLLVAIFGWLVFGRYVLGSTPTWVEPLSLLLIVIITFFSAAVGLREGTHLCVEILPNMVSPKLRRLLAVVVNLMLAFFGAIMAVHAYGLAKFMWAQMIPLLNVPEGLRSVPIVVSGVLMVLFALENILLIFAGEDAAKIEEDETLPGGEIVIGETR